MNRLALLVALAGCGGGPSITDPPPAGTGTFDLQWQVQVGGVPSSCAAVGATEVEIITTGAATGERVQRFSCQSGSATTQPLPVGQYTTLISLLDAGASSLQTLPMETNTIRDGDSTDIGFFFFSFGSTCDASTCGGCCNDTGTCVNTQTDSQCGLGGSPCQDCQSAGLFCETTGGFCTN